MIKLWPSEQRLLRLLTDTCRGCWVDAVLIDEMATAFPEDIFFLPGCVSRGWVATMKRPKARVKHDRSTAIAYSITSAGAQALRLGKVRPSEVLPTVGPQAD